jgi:sulfane dehydrogenase subunit SoxC
MTVRSTGSKAIAEQSAEAPAPSLSRRSLLAGTIGAISATLLDNASALPAQTKDPVPSPPALDDPGNAQGHIPTELGERSPFEHPRRRVNRPAPSGESETPLQDLYGTITPADLHFERHHGGVPVIDPARYTLLIHGMVERPLKFTLADLKRFPAVSRVCFVECSGNGYRGFQTTTMKREATPSWIDGLLSTSEWTGVPLSTLFREAGAMPDAKWFLAEGSDAAHMTRSIPVEKALDDAMIAYAQNGEAIRPEQGYPARLLLPGWEGNSQVKWIKRIELAKEPFMTREETSKYTDPLANGTARMFSFVMDAKSLITFPAYPNTLSKGWCVITGLAWSGRGKIGHVEVSTDGGNTWQSAELQAPILSKCTTRFRYAWKYDGGEAVLMSRAIDETGYMQPTRAQLVAARGAGTFYHMNSIRAWKVERGGKVFFDVGA